MSIKKVFRFSYRSGLDAEACKARLTDDYRDKLSAEGTAFEYRRKNWSLTFKTSKKGVIKMSPDTSQLYFCFRASLHEDLGGTTIAITHNPFSLFAIGYTTFWALLGLFAVIYGITDLAFSPSPSGAAGQVAILGLLLLFLPFGAISIVKESTARNTVIEYLEKALDAKPVD